MKPIYKPSGRAAEYGEYALNIYTGCNHGCEYCYVPQVLHLDRDAFHKNVVLRKDITEAVKWQIEKDNISDRLIHLCFTCDPYPAAIDTTPTREIIKILKDTGNRVQILTKGGHRAERDFDLLDSRDWFGVTVTGGNEDSYLHEPGAAGVDERLRSLMAAKERGINTWVSCEPVYNPEYIYDLIMSADYIDRFNIGKLNYIHSDIDWHDFGYGCQFYGTVYNKQVHIKDDLLKEMTRERHE